ncbi:MAG TPA: HXXEE domain-containing protein [Aestuariivirga sp.]
MLQRLYDNWVYGGFLMGLVLLALWPLFKLSLSWSGALVLLALSAYAIHQYEEHDADRFRAFVNTTMAKGRAGLSKADVFYINVLLVWCLLALNIWLVERVNAGWALLGALLLLVNAATHIGYTLLTRQPNPGVWTAALLFLPLGIYMLLQVWPLASFIQFVICLVVVLGIHAWIFAHARRSVA